jgi:hypothetical protein
MDSYGGGAVKRLFIFTLVLAAVAPALGMTFPDVPYGRVLTCGDYLLAFTMGRSNRFFMLDRAGEIVLDSQNSGWDYDAYIDGSVTPDGRNLALRVDDARVSYVVVVGPDGGRREFKYDYSCSEPVWDGDGNLWYTAGGLLYKNGESTGFGVKSDHISISPDGRYLAYAPYLWLPTDSRSPASLEKFDAIYRLDLETGAKDLIADNREFIIPCYTTTGHIIAACREGEVWLFGPDGEGEMISEGIQPSWCDETNSILFIRAGPEADGEYIPESEIWLYELTGNLRQMTDTPDVAETWPVSWRGDIVATENESNEIIYIKQEW